MSSPRGAGVPFVPKPVPLVHVVTNDEIIDRPDFIERACGVMAVLGVRGAVHLRGARTTGARLQELGEQLAAAQGTTGAWLVVNDRVDVALAVRAVGAQLTSRSLTVDDARRAAPSLVIGASVHSLDDARAAVDAGADWMVAGHVFATPSHAGEPARGLPFVRALTGSTVPVIAIGGVRPTHWPLLREAGVAGVAVIRGVWDAPHAERAASDYLSAYDDARST